MQDDHNLAAIHGAASCGNVAAVIDLIEKYGINPRCKGHVRS